MELKWFDANIGLGRSAFSKNRVTANVVALQEALGRYNIDRALVYHFNGKELHPNIGNEQLGREISGREGLYPCFSLVPGCDYDFPKPEDFMAQLQEKGVRAVRIFPEIQHLELDDWVLGDFWSPFAAHRLPVFLEYDKSFTWGSLDQHAVLKEVYELCQRHPQLPVVFTCPRIRFNRVFYKLLESCPNLRTDLLPFWNFCNVEHFAERLGAGKLIFSSGLPLQDPGGTISMVAYARLGDNEKARIAGGNLEELLNEVRF